MVKLGSIAWLVLWLASSVFAVLLVQHPSGADGAAGTLWAVVILAMAAVWLVGMIIWGYVLARQVTVGTCWQPAFA